MKLSELHGQGVVDRLTGTFFQDTPHLDKFTGIAAHIREVDAMVQVVRCFENSNIEHVMDTVDPIRDIEIINTELVLCDLDAVKKKRASIAKDAKRGDKEAITQDAVLAKIEPVLDAGKPALTIQLTPEERAAFLDHFHDLL